MRYVPCLKLQTSETFTCLKRIPNLLPPECVQAWNAAKPFLTPAGKLTSWGRTKFKFGKLILRKIIKTVAARCHILRLKCTKFNFGWALPHTPLGELCLPDPQLDLMGPTSKGRGEREKGKEEGEGEEREGWECCIMPVGGWTPLRGTPPPHSPSLLTPSASRPWRLNSCPPDEKNRSNAARAF